MLLAQTSFLGDVVLTTALARTIERAWPEHELWWLVRPDAAPLLAPGYGPGRVLPFDKRGRDRGPAGVVRVAARLRAIGFDAAIGVQRSLRTAAVLALARIPIRVGYARSAGAWLYHRRVPQKGAHARDRLVALARGLEIEPPETPAAPHLEVSPEAASRVARRLHEQGVGADQGLIVVSPGSAWVTKQWPAQHFGDAAAMLQRDGRDRVVVIGTEADRGRAARIGEAVARRGGPEIVDATGTTSIADAVAWIARARLVLANDSAPAHIAAALDRPVVALFGPTTPAQGFAPLGAHVRIVERSLPCRPCSRHGGDRCPIGTHECLEALPPQSVVAAAERLLAGAGDGGAPCA